ncbi:single-stranded DNA-binding protein [Prochlorococcus marinus]|uniref:Single-stranded DNA-binding protein n=1 Tax=Prochlorococcus marinus XMU1408 TaxID=2213228 RepID=A0A318QZ60_PROMR|nr:single-stranded DNA-binding protein [Prochlorococcus marinus]MBW3041529.1 single-stranded DNA-binding protein [Prochlorococcus marinus str. XMU1408]PYE02687.1 single-stranded DNA-binding protein [Prochlorococcus marinus XMU1408]
MNHCMLEVLVKKAPTVRFTQDNKTPLAEIEAEFDSLRADDPPSSIKVIGWGKLAEELQNKVQVNSKLVIEGRLRMNSVTRQDGTKEKQAEFTLSRIHPLSTNIALSSIPSKTQSNQKNNSATSSNNESVKWDSSPLIPDTDDIPF